MNVNQYFKFHKALGLCLRPLFLYHLRQTEGNIKARSDLEDELLNFSD